MFGAQLRDVIQLSVAIGLFETQGSFHYFELHTLETGCRAQEIAEIEKIKRGHGFHHVNLFDQQLQDGLHPAEAVENGIKIGRVVVDDRLLEQAENRVYFVNDLFEPQFVSLMRDDKKHFIVGGFACFFTFQFLRVQDFIQLQIIAVVDALFGEVHDLNLVRMCKERAFGEDTSYREAVFRSGLHLAQSHDGSAYRDQRTDGKNTFVIMG